MEGMTPEQQAARRLEELLISTRSTSTSSAALAKLCVEHLSAAGLLILTAERAADLLDARATVPAGYALVPVTLDEPMRRAIWTAWAERQIHTAQLRPQAVQARLASNWQAEADATQWHAMHAEAARRMAPHG